MRRSWLALLVVAAVTVIACAHPTEDPLPGETLADPTATATHTARPTPSRSGTPTRTSDPAVTEEVCDDAQSVTQDAVDEIMAKVAQAQANPAAAIAQAIVIGEEWKSKLEDFRDEPVTTPVRDTLDEGIDMIDDLLRTLRTNPTSLISQANQIQDQIDEFQDNLADACE